MALSWGTASECAESLVALGLCLLRLPPGKKDPPPAGFPEHAPLSLDEAVAWVSQDPPGNLGIRTGKVPSECSVVVLDLDVNHDEGDDPDAPDGLKAAMDLGLVVPTWTCRTGRGGLHLYFVAPSDVKVKNSVGKIAQGIDVRGHHGYAVAPGSIHPDTLATYAWQPGLAPREIDLAPIHDALRGALARIGGLEVTTRADGQTAAPGGIQGIQGLELATGTDPLMDVPGCGQGTRNQRCAQLAGLMLAAEIGEKQALASLLAWAKRCTPPMPPHECKRTWASVLAGDRLRHPERHGPRVKVQVTDDLATMIDQIEATLTSVAPAGSEGCIYRRAGELVYANARGVVPLTHPNCRELISRHIRLTERSRPAKWAHGHLVSALMDRRESESKIPSLQGVLPFPVLVRDPKSGDVLLAEPGYDARTRMLGCFPRWPAFEPARTSAEASKLAELVLDPFREFPWFGLDDRFSLLALLLTMVMRPIIEGPVPCWVVRATAPGTGKTLLVQCVHQLVMGEMPAMHPPTEQGEELRKVLLGVARSGWPTFVIDNAVNSFGDSAISQAVTANSISGRILGTPLMLELPWRTIIIATGNHLSFRADMSRRVMLVDLEARVEHPELRSFEEPYLLRHVLDKRPELLTALLSIAMGFAVQKEPPVIAESLGGFEAWSATVRSCCIWAVGVDPCNSRQRLDDDDLDTSLLREVLRFWWACWADKTVSLTDLGQRSSEPLKGALLTYAGSLLPHHLAGALRGAVGRPIGGLMLMKPLPRGGRQAWRVRALAKEPLQPKQLKAMPPDALLELPDPG